VSRPFLLGPIFAAQGWNNSPFNLYPVKGRYMWRDMERLCADAGLPLVRPSEFPRGSLLAARLAAAHQDAPWVPAFFRRVYRANFGEDRAIGEPDVIVELLTELGLDAAALVASAQTAAAKQALREQTDRAIALGIFGAPTFVVGKELFWGSDRMQHAVRFWKQQA
jgi:2-hydroxychromene-2-carboxylate isomerase